MKDKSGFSEPSEHVLQNTSVLEVLDLNVGVQTHLGLEGLVSVSCYLNDLVHLEVSSSDVNVECFFSSKTYIEKGIPRLSALCPGRNSSGRIPIPAKLLL